jgi:hypothetical protein
MLQSPEGAGENEMLLCELLAAGKILVSATL